MKRFLIIAFATVALTLVVTSGRASAGDHHYGGGHGYAGGHGFPGGHSRYGRGYTGGYGHSGYGYSGYSRATPYYGSAYRGNAPSHGGGHYAPSYRFYRPVAGGHGGVHLDVGRLHLGVGGHH